MSDKSKITVVVPENLQKEMHQMIIDGGYGMRGKSKWVAEAIQDFLALSNIVELVALGDELKGFEKVETIIIDKKLKAELDKAILNVRVHHPMLEGVQSRIIRSSILQRLLRS